MKTTNTKLYSNLINGNWHPPGTDVLENHNPADYNEVIGLFPMSTLEDTKDAIAAAHAALPIWAKTPAPAR